MKYAKLIMFIGLLILLSSFANAIINDSLIHAWNLNETDYTDSVGGNALIDNGGADTVTGFHPVGVNNRYTNDTDEHLVTTAAFDPPVNMTVCTWIKVFSSPFLIAIFRQAPLGEHDYWDVNLLVDDTIHAQTHGGGYITADSVTPISLNVWHHLCIAANLTQVSLIIDGVINDTTIGTRTTGANTKEFFVSGKVTATPDMVLDEIYYWDRMLNASEFSELYNSGSGIFYPDFGALTVPSGDVDMLFANDTDLTIPTTTFDEGEPIFVFVNWTNDTSNVPLNDTVGFCNITLEEGIYEDELDNITTNVSLCNTGCTYDDFKVEFDAENNKSVLDDYVELNICHNNAVQEDVDINIDCSSGSGATTILQSEFSKCVDGFSLIRKRISGCNQSIKVNVTIDNNAININQGHLISEFAFDREFKNHTTPTEFNGTLQLWRTVHSHEYYEHGSKIIHVNCTHNTNSSMDVKTNEQITIVNIPPLIFFQEIQYGGGIVNLTNQVIIEYFSDIWTWMIAVIDDDLDNITYTFRNSTDIIQVNSSSIPINIITIDALFLDFDGNPYNLTVTANDTFGNVTTSSISFNITDTTDPSCTGFDNTSVGNNTNHTWNAICTDENFFSLNVSCTGSDNFNYFKDGLQTTSFNFVNTTLIIENTTCLIEYCDGHTLNIIEDIEIGDKGSSSRRTFDDKISIFSDKGFKNFNINKDSDRYTFDIETTIAYDETTFIVSSNDFIHIMNDINYAGWIITGDYWIDFENEELKSINVSRISPYSVSVHIKFKKPVKKVFYESIGKLNCVQQSQLLASVITQIDPFTLKRFRCDLSTAGMAIGIIGFSFLIFILWMFLWYIGIPFLSILFGVIIAYYGWVVAACFFLANVLFIVMGVVLIIKGIIDTLTSKNV